MKYWHLTLLVILAVSLPAIAVTNNIILNSAESQIMETTRSMMEGIADSQRDDVVQRLDYRVALLDAVVETPTLAEDSRAVVADFYGGDPAMDERQRILDVIDRLSLGENRGAVIAVLDPTHGAIVLSSSHAQLEGYVPFNESTLFEVKKDRDVTYLPALPWEAVPAVVVTHPVTDDFGRVVSLVAAIVDGHELTATISDEEELGTGGGVYLVGPDKRLLTPSPEGDATGSVISSEGAERALDGDSGYHVMESSDKVIEAYMPVNGWDMALVVQMDHAKSEELVSVVRISALAASLIVAGALVVISVIISKNLVRDLGSLVEWSKDVGGGDYEAPLELGPTDEFQELQRSFKQMVRDLMKHQSQLRMAERRFSSLFKDSLDPVYIARSDGRIMELNPAGEQVLGLPRREDGTYGYSLEELFADDDARREFIGLLEREAAVAGFEARFRLPAGRELFVLISSTRRMDDEGRTLAYQGVIHDITDRKHFEEALIQAKNEAEFYCDIMSHDLNNAVQGLGGYLELCNLANDLEDVNQFLPYAHDQMSRASDLLRNVRRLSHLGSQDVELIPMDLQKVLVKAMWAVERAHAHEVIDVRIDVPDDIPQVLGEAFIEDVFINLLDNAIKYDTHEEKVVDVIVRREEFEGAERVRVHVADRGPGVADRDKQTIFGRFERKALKEYGTGLGLSIVVKALERSGGRTWVEDRVTGDHTQGAAFVVELLAVVER